jgi:hypothetical protein
MAQSREQTLIQEKCKDQAMQQIIASKNREIEELRSLVENNPLLAERHAKVLDLEL